MISNYTLEWNRTNQSSLLLVGGSLVSIFKSDLMCFRVEADEKLKKLKKLKKKKEKEQKKMYYVKFV